MAQWLWKHFLEKEYAIETPLHEVLLLHNFVAQQSRNLCKAKSKPLYNQIKCFAHEAILEVTFHKCV